MTPLCILIVVVTSIFIIVGIILTLCVQHRSRNNFRPKNSSAVYLTKPGTPPIDDDKFQKLRGHRNILFRARGEIEFTDQGSRENIKWPSFLSKGRGFRKSVIKTNRGTFIKSWTKIHRKRYLREKTAYQKLQRTDIVPRLLNYNDKTLEIEIEDAGIPLRDMKHLRKLNKIEKEAPDWREQIQDIVQILYQYNIGHGDWSGANILYKNGRLKIIDFDKGHMPSEKYFENVRIPVLPKKNQRLNSYLKSIEGMDKFIDSSVANNLENAN